MSFAAWALQAVALITLHASRAIVNTSPPPAVMAMSNQFASHKHRTLHSKLFYLFYQIE